MELTGLELRTLNEALGDAFDPDSFEQLLLFHVNRRIHDYASDRDSMPTIIFAVTTAAQAEGWLPDLINAAHTSRPHSEQIAAIAERIGISSLSEAVEADIQQDLENVEIAPCAKPNPLDAG